MTQKAIWFSRHQPTADQLADAERLGFEITGIDAGKQLGAIDIRNNNDLMSVVCGILSQVTIHNAKAVFGVPSAPIQGQLARTAQDAIGRGELTKVNGQETGDVPFFAAWNVQRSVDGGKPTFTHQTWLLVGWLSQASCRWLV